jgi:integrase
MAKAKGIYKRGNVYWICYADPFGKMRYESSRSSAFKDAQALLVLRKKEVQEGISPIPVRQITNHAFQELVEHYKAWGLGRQRGFQTKIDHLRQLSAVFGNLPLRSFTTRLLEEWQSKRMEKNKPATVNRMLATLKHMFTKAVEWDMVEEAVWKRVRKVKLLPENNRRLRYLSQEECQRLVSICNSYLKPIVITALNTGMRKGEILSLQWEKHIDLRHGFILLDMTKNGERREIPINQTLRETLTKIPRRIDSPYVFTDENGDRFLDVKKGFGAACRRSGWGSGLIIEIHGRRVVDTGKKVTVSPRYFLLGHSRTGQIVVSRRTSQIGQHSIGSSPPPPLCYPGLPTAGYDGDQNHAFAFRSPVANIPRYRWQNTVSAACTGSLGSGLLSCHLIPFLL